MLTFTDLSQAPLVLNGSAAEVGAVLRLTGDMQQQAGSAYLSDAFAVGKATRFNIHFSFQIHGGGGTGGADGMTFLWQNDPRGAAALGGPGGSLGYTGIGASVAVRFDDHFNAPPEPSGNNYVATATNGVSSSMTASNLPFKLNDGAVHHAWIEYDGALHTLTVFLSSSANRPAQALLTDTIDLEAIVGSRAFIGFTAGTGGGSNIHDVLSLDVDFVH